jgi:hypothetical protein
MKTATAVFGSTPITEGDITRGTVVEVELDGESPSEGTADVVVRATVALFGGHDTVPPGTDGEIYWTITESKGASILSVEGPNGSEDIIRFWVF